MLAQPVRTCMSDIDMLDGTYLSNVQFQAFLLSCSGLVAAPDGQGSRTSEASAVNSSCLLYTSPSPRDRQKSRMPSSA